MEVGMKMDNDILNIRISGIIDTDAAEILRLKLERAVERKPLKVIMDLFDVPMVGSSGIGKIIFFFENLKGIDSSFEIKGIQANVYHMFMALRLDSLFPIAMK